jgi:pimeloyl-ACP methyl ester carboxylesterase
MEIETICFESKDANIVGDVYIPKEPKEYAIILQHGFGVNRHEIEDIAKYFANENYLTLVYDLRGHNESTGEFNINYMIDDVSKAIDYMEEKYGVKKFAIVGHSMGGLIAPFAAMDDDRIYACSILASTSSLQRSAKEANYFQYILGSFLKKTRLTKLLRFPVKFTELEMSRYRPGEPHTGLKVLHYGRFLENFLDAPEVVEHIHELTVPFQVIHGNNDDVVPLKHGKDLFKRAVNTDYKEMEIIDGADHGFEGYRPLVCEKMVNFFNKVLP